MVVGIQSDLLISWSSSFKKTLCLHYHNSGLDGKMVTVDSLSGMTGTWLCITLLPLH
jgi:hypothetical protein